MLGSSKIDNVPKLEDEHTVIEILNFQIRYVKTYFEFKIKEKCIVKAYALNEVKV